MIPKYIDEIYLQKVFKDYASSIEDFIIESTTNEHIVDSQEMKICGFVSKTFGLEEEYSEKYFSVENPSSKPFSLVQIDNAIIKMTAETKKCDCLIVNGRNICFIEFKTNARSTKKTTINKNYKAAVGQIEATIDIFNKYYKTINTEITSIKGKEVKAFICLRKGYPRTTSTQINYQDDFAQKNKGIPLYFERGTTL